MNSIKLFDTISTVHCFSLFPSSVMHNGLCLKPLCIQYLYLDSFACLFTPVVTAEEKEFYSKKKSLNGEPQPSSASLWPLLQPSHDLLVVRLQSPCCEEAVNSRWWPLAMTSRDGHCRIGHWDRSTLKV